MRTSIKKLFSIVLALAFSLTLLPGGFVFPSMATAAGPTSITTSVQFEALFNDSTGTANAADSPYILNCTYDNTSGPNIRIPANITLQIAAGGELNITTGDRFEVAGFLDVQTSGIMNISNSGTNSNGIHGSVTVSGGTVNIANTGTNSRGIYCSYSEVNIHGGTVNIANTGTGSRGIYCGSSIMNISGGDVVVKNTAGNGIRLDDATVNLSSGTLVLTNTDAASPSMSGGYVAGAITCAAGANIVFMAKRADAIQGNGAAAMITAIDSSRANIWYGSQLNAVDAASSSVPGALFSVSPALPSVSGFAIPYTYGAMSLYPVKAGVDSTISASAGTLSGNLAVTATSTPPWPTDAQGTYSVSLLAPKAITAFTLAGVAGTINETAGTIALTVPYGTSISNIAPAITHTGASISPLDSAAQNFQNPATYTVTASDTLTKTYTVTVTVAPQPYSGGTFLPPPPPPAAPKTAFPCDGEVIGRRIDVFKFETLKTRLFRLSKGEEFTILGLANEGRAFQIEQDGRKGYIAFKDIAATFGAPLRATALKKANAYTLLESGKLKRVGYFDKDKTLWVQGISGKYLINKQRNNTYYLDASQWKLWIAEE